MSYTKDEIKLMKQRIGKNAISLLPEEGVVNIGYGIASSYLTPEIKDNYPKLLIQVESCVLGMTDFNGDIPHRVDPAGVMVNVSERASKSDTITDAFSLMNRGKIDQTYLGALQVDSYGNLANWAASENEKYGIGGAAELCANAKEVIILMIEDDKFGNSKLLEKCTMPLTYPACVSLIVTEKGFYKPAGAQTELEWSSFDNEKSEEVEKILYSGSEMNGWFRQVAKWSNESESYEPYLRWVKGFSPE